MLPLSRPPLITQKGRFVDPQGRQVTLHGINLVNKNRSQNYLSPQEAADYAAMRRWGFNCLRLGVIWDGLEPEPGVFAEDYLRGIDRQVAWAGENGLYVFLDMHQDLFSVLYSDGAPAWATLTADQPHVDLGGVWSDAYFTSPAVQAAFDRFWANAPAPDGTGLQDHYAMAWQTLARRYSGNPTIIGYDLMNEPFPGSAALPAQMMLFAKGAELLHDQLSGSVETEDLLNLWMDPQGRARILALLQDADLFARLVDVMHPVFSAFEQGPLMDFYCRVSRAIRAVDPHSILFLETSMGSNMGVYSGIEPLQSDDGQRDPQQAYAPHGYDLVVDTTSNADVSPERVALIFSRHDETAQRWDWPMLAGEWGAYGILPGTLPAAQTVVGQFEKLLCSDTYWVYENDLASAPAFQALWRPYPERVSGILQNYHFDPHTRLFSCTWQEDPAITAPSRIYLPDWLSFDPTHLTLEPFAAGYSLDPTHPGGLWLNIPPTGEQNIRTLKVQG